MSSRPPRVKNLLASFERTICQNNEVGVSSGMYLTTQLAGRDAGVLKPTVGQRRHSPTKKRIPDRQTSASTATVTLSDHDSVSREELGPRPLIKARASKSGTTVENECVGFTVAYSNDALSDDDTASCVSFISFASGSRRSSIVHGRNAHAATAPLETTLDDAASAASAISRTSGKILELPRDVSFDSDDSSSSSEEDVSESDSDDGDSLDSQSPSRVKRAPVHW